MGIGVEHTKDKLQGDGVTTKFPFSFPVTGKEQVKCVKVLASGEEIQILTTEYTVKVSEIGGEVTYPLTGEALQEDEYILIYRSTAIKQDYSPDNGNTFDALVIRKEIDRLTMIAQELQEQLNRAVKTQISSEISPDGYLDEINRLLANARELNDNSVKTCEDTLRAVLENARICEDDAVAVEAYLKEVQALAEAFTAMVETATKEINELTENSKTDITTHATAVVSTTATELNQLTTNSKTDITAHATLKMDEYNQNHTIKMEIVQDAVEKSQENAVRAETAAAFADNTVDGFDAHALEKQNQIDASANAAAQSAAAALISETNAADSATAAAVSQAEANASQTKASNSAAEAKESETHAKISETAAKESETKAKASEIQALSSETKAKESEGKALTSANSAAQSAVEAERFRNEAEEIANLPEMSETVKGAVMAATEAEVLAGAIDNKAVTPQKLKLHTGDNENPHKVTAEQIGLGRVDNTADLDKPVSTATKNLIENKVYPESACQKRIIMDAAVIPYRDDVTRYQRNVAAGDVFTIDLSQRMQIGNDITIELILKMPAAVSFDLSQILPLGAGETADENKKWLNGSSPDFSEAGEYWIVLFSVDDGATWRATYEGKFNL